MDFKRLGLYQRSDRGNVGVALTFLFIGLGAGALSALLFAPKSGKQMRRALRRSYEDARDTLDDWKDNAGQMLDRGADLANAAKERVAPIGRAVTGR